MPYYSDYQFEGLIGIVLPAVGYFRHLAKPVFQQMQRNSSGHPALSVQVCVKNRIIGNRLFSHRLLYHSCQFYRQSMMVATPVACTLIASAQYGAVGMVFLLAPSGWLMRLISPSVTGLSQPPLWGVVPDPFGMALVFGLVTKELPFLFAAQSISVCKPANYAFVSSWCWAWLWAVASWTACSTLVYRHIRLPVIAVLVFSHSRRWRYCGT